MPLSHTTKWYAVSDAKIAKVTADPSGGSTTYGTLIDVPGIKSVGVGGDINNTELRGDNTQLDSRSVLSSISLEFEHAKLNLDALAVMLGGAAADSGTTPAQKVTYDLLNTDGFSYFKFEARTPTDGVDTLGGDGHILLHKCILSEFPDLGLAEEDYKTSSVSAVAVPLLSNGKWLSIVLNETQLAIA